MRPWRDDDARFVQEPDEASRLMATRMQPTPGTYDQWLRDRRECMESGAALYWCIADAGSDEPLGYVRLARLDQEFTRGSGELGYWLYPHARGRGVMAETVEAVRQHAFAPRAAGGLGLHRLQAGTNAANLASARVLRRAGFRMWGIERSVLAHPGGPSSDALNWELLATDDVDSQRISPLHVPTIELDGIRLRAWRDDDADLLPDEPDELARQYLPAPSQLTKASYAGWLERQRYLVDEATAVPWCIADTETDAPLGSITVFNIGEGTATSAEVGYWLLPAGRGRGLLSAAVEAVVSHSFSAQQRGGLGLTRLYAETDLDNVASQSALRGAGFRKWGEDRQAYTAADGRITDGAYFELLASDDREAQRAVDPPVLDFPAIRLRPLRRADAESIAATFADPQVRHWLSTPSDDLAGRAASYVARKRHVDLASHGSWWVICPAGSDDFHGVIGLQNFTEGNAEVGYWLATEARGRGLTRAALDTVRNYAFMSPATGGLGLRRLHLGVADGNHPSQRAALGAGFVQYGTAHAAEVLGDGSVVDLLLYECLAPQAG
nr:GNAT family N-acetyltransferase [Flexivirga oryzae]